MGTVAWRRLLLALCAFAVLHLGLEVWLESARFATMPGFDSPFYGPAPSAASVHTSPTATPQVIRLVFPPSSPLARAGVRSGDLLDLRTASPAERYRWWTGYWWRGERVLATIERGGAVRHVVLTATWAPLDWLGAVSNAGEFWMLAFASILAWRRPDSAEARALALLLILNCIGLDFQPQGWISPWPLLDAALNSLSGPLYACGITLFATYAMLFARPASALRRGLAWAAYGVAALTGVVELVAPAWPVFALPGAAFLSDTILLYGSALPFLFPMLCAVATIPATRGAERTRFLWASIPLLPLYLVSVCAVPAPAFGVGWANAWLYVTNIAIFIAPLGLTYALLSRRLLDIGFALNRAAVFAVMSLVLAGLFAGLQWLANRLVAGSIHDATTEIAIVVIV